MQKSSVQYVSIQAGVAGQRIDNFLVARLKGVPKTHIYRILRKGEVRVNKKRTKPSYKLQEGDQIRLPPLQMSPDSVPPQPGPSLMAYLAERILYEDAHLLIINKPSGIPVHGGSQVKIGIVEALRCMYPKLPQLELVHRLDADTSGCLILSKKRSILRELHEMLRAKKIEKIYWALTQGHWKEAELTVDVPLLKNQISSGERIVRVNAEGKPSLTLFRVLKEFANTSLMEVKLETGRTHQIRVHAKYRGHAVAGDEKYGDKQLNRQMQEAGLRRLFLHAYSINFTLLSLGRQVRVSAPLDPDLATCLEALKNA
ncbi:MAG: rluC [Gammaproteobacteria bacterium]|jgi:23S rRNA pseudouridine955/2504/2580 synthase|nr:rluC [Gammaproteobacteria bacterium]